ncbi:NAD(P)-dependent oxidoreductase [Halovulum sp. GXIMD14794]
MGQIMKTAVVGCGAMGAPMAEALMNAGADIIGLDVRPSDAFGPLMPVMTSDPKALADRQVVISVVRDVLQTEQILFGPDAFLPHAAALETLVISSTLSPRYTRSLASRLPASVTLIDAPMSGAPVAAIERRLTFMLGGDSDRIGQLMPLFEAMGTRFHHMGGTGAGMTAKVLNNLIAASSTAATRTALEIGKALDVDDERLRAVFADSSGQTWFGSNFDRISWAREGFDPENTMGILKKDVEAAIDAATEDAEVELPRAIIAAISRLAPFD